MIPSERTSTGLSLTYEDYLVMDSMTLKTLPKRKLYEIIYRFDTEVALLKKNAESATAQINEKATEVAELQEQVNFVKKTNQLLSSELLSAHQSNSANKKKYEEVVKLLEGEVAGKQPNSDESCQVLKLKIQEIKRKKKRLKQEVEELQVKTRDMAKENTGLQEELEKVKFSKDSLGFEMVAMKDSLTNKNKVLKEALKAIQLKNHRKKEKMLGLESQVQELKTEISENKHNLHKTQLESEALREELQISKKQLDALQQQEHNSELLETLKDECEDLKIKYVRSLHNNDKLIKKIIDLKQKQMNARQEVMKLSNRIKAGSEPNTPIRSNLKSSPWVIKTQINKIYKDFIGEIQRSTDGNNSFYSMQSEQFSSIEKRLNELILLLHETLEENENQNENDPFDKLEPGVGEKIQSSRMLQCVGLRSSVDGSKKRASSLRPSLGQS